MKKLLFLFLIAVCFTSLKASAGNVDLNLLYYSDTLSTTTNSSSSKTLYDFCVGFSVYKNDSILIGWNYGSYATSSTANSSTTTYSST